ncbi:hypothetical protein [uncultured Algibacter sp.]|uniref:hypothetical protein n=1 Tax=uncultured Algibacter sp. TaxID=298659 RepID=UPI0032172739
MIPYKDIQIIEKENIKFLNFPKDDVFNKHEDKIDRIINLNRGLSLGNLEQQKVKILFVDDQGLKRVETTIWGITDKSVILKQSTILPLKRIISIA